MLQDIIEVRALPGYRLYLSFEDGVQGEIELKKIIKFTGIFEPLEEYDYFSQVIVNPDLGTIQWPNEADLDPDVLYNKITEQNLSNQSTFDDLDMNLDSNNEDWDIIQIRVYNYNILDVGMPINEAIKILKSTKDLLLYTALSTIEPKPIFQAKKSKQAIQYIENIHVENISVEQRYKDNIINLISPLPFGREVLQKMFVALNLLNTMGMTEDISTIESNQLKTFINKGISYNFCESLIAITNASKGKEIALSLKVSPRLKFPTYIPQKIKLSREIIENVKNIKNCFKKNSQFFYSKTK